MLSSHPNSNDLFEPVIPVPPKFQQDFVWRKPALLNNKLSASLRVWLLDDGSLTRRLQSICPGKFRVQLMSQSWCSPLISEAQQLNISYKQRVFTREVVLFCGNRAMVFARTVIPRRTLKGHLSRLANLGEKPLGEILFADPRIQRSNLEIAPLRTGHYLYSTTMNALNTGGKTAEMTIWARRSTFAYHKKSLLVSEIFLPNHEFGYGKRWPD